jgi:hypothetical protein
LTVFHLRGPLRLVSVDDFLPEAYSRARKARIFMQGVKMIEPKTKRAYLIGLPVVAVIYFLIYWLLLAQAIGIGDSANPVLPPVHGMALSILNFPMMYLYVPLGDWLEPLLSDNGVLYLFAGLNSLFWGAGIVTLGIWTRQLKKRKPIAES